MQWLKSLFAPKAPVTHKATPIPAAVDFEVPRYPPFMKGLPTIEPERLIAQHPEILAHYKRSVIVTPEQYEQFYIGALRRFAAYAHLLPASQTHHHRGAGGLLRHSMEVALWSLQGADNMLLSMGKSPAQRRAIEPRWQLTAFLAGLCHDVGKPATDMTITDSDRNITWKPLTEDLYEWAKRNSLKAYFLDWRPGRGKQHVSLSNLLAERIIGPEALQWIDEGGTELVVWLMEALSGNPGATNPLYDLVIRADSSSTERDLKTMGVAMAGYELGVPIERHLMDIMRRLIKEGIWQVNELGARVWNINGGIYLVWPASGEEIAAKVRSDDLKGFPRTPDGILDMLLERGLAFVRETGEERFWRIVPAELEAKIPNKSLVCIRLRDDAMISSTPIAAVAGRLLNGEDEEPSGGGAQADAPEEPTSPVHARANQDAAGTVRDPLSPPPQVQANGSAKPSQAAVEAITIAKKATPASSTALTATEVPAPAEAAETPKPPLRKLDIDPDTGEILGIEASPADGGKKQPKLRQVQKSAEPEHPLAKSRPVGVKLKSAVADSAENAPEAATPSDAVGPDASSTEPEKKKRRKKGSFAQQPELEFSGSVGELFLALADDLQTGAKQWGVDVRVDDQEMVLLRWPGCFANYGLTAKTILDECGKNGWIWIDQDMPFVKLVDTKFQGEDSKALRLMPEPGDALLYHAKYNPDLHSNPAPKVRTDSAALPSDEAVLPPVEPAMDIEPQVQSEVQATSLPENSAQLTLLDDVSSEERKVLRTDRSAPPAKPRKAAETKAAMAPNRAETAVAATNVKALKEKLGSKPKSTPQIKLENVAPAESGPSLGALDPRVGALIGVLDGCAADKVEQGWRYIDRLEIRRAALAAGVAKDRKDLNVIIEANAKIFQVKGQHMRYKPAASGSAVHA
jgi:conjugal transfer pilus assembly protein TraI